MILIGAAALELVERLKARLANVNECPGREGEDAAGASTARPGRAESVPDGKKGATPKRRQVPPVLGREQVRAGPFGSNAGCSAGEEDGNA